MSRAVAFAATAVGLVLVLVPLWWWALFGMSPHVGTAWMVTDVLVYFAVAGTWIASSE